MKHYMSIRSSEKRAPDKAQNSPQENGHLFGTIGNAAAGQVIRGQFYSNPVSRENPDVILAHFTGYMCQDDMIIIQFDPEHCIGQGFNDCSFYFNCFFFSQRFLLIFHLFIERRLITRSMAAVKSSVMPQHMYSTQIMPAV